MIRRHKGIIWTIIIAALLRIALLAVAIQFREHPDILRWKDWGRIAFLYGFADTYTPTHLAFGTYPNNMPPGTLYIVSALYWMWLQMGKVLALFGIAPGSNPWVNVVLLRIFINVPSLLSDLLIGWFVYDMVLRLGKDGKRPILAASLYLFNPAVLYNSAVWGQMDSVNNVFFVAALWLLFRKRIVGSALSFASSLLVKFSLVFAAPFWLLAAWYRSGKRMVPLLMACIAGLALIMIVLLPVSGQPFGWLWAYVTKNGTGEMTNVTAFAFNAWWVVFRPELVFLVSRDITRVVDIHLVGAPLAQTMYGSIPLGAIATAVGVAVQIPVYVVFLRRMKKGKPFDPQLIISVFASLAILSYLFLPQMHERYLYPSYALLALLIGMGIPILWEYTALSVLNTVNLLAVWHPMPLSLWTFGLLRNGIFQWWISVLTVLIGLETVWKIHIKSR